VRQGVNPLHPLPPGLSAGPPGGDTQAGEQSLPLPGVTFFPLAALPRPRGGAAPQGAGVGVEASQHFPPPAGAACVRPAPSDRRERGAVPAKREHGLLLTPLKLD